MAQQIATMRPRPDATNRIVRVIGAVFVLSAACNSEGLLGIKKSTTFTVGTALHDIEVGTLARSYVLHVPTRRPTSGNGTLMAYPLMIVLHGSAATGDDIRGTSNMDSVSEAHRWVVAYPNGVQGAGGLFPSDWNAGTCCGAAGRENIDDVGFLQHVITEIATSLPIDRRRVYVVGFSDGGRMAHHVACAMASQIAGIAVVSGSLRDDQCAPSAAVPVIAIHGTDDANVPWDEAADTPPLIALTGLASTLPPSMQFWASKNGCTSGSSSALSAHVDQTLFPLCKNAELAFYAIIGGAHTWPMLVNSASANPDETFGTTAIIALFLKRQALK